MPNSIISRAQVQVAMIVAGLALTARAASGVRDSGACSRAPDRASLSRPG